MNADMKRKQQLESAMKEVLGHAEGHSSSHSWELAEAGEHVFVFGLAPFYTQDDPEALYFLVPTEAEQKLMEKVDSLFDSQIRAATVRNSLSGAMTEVGQEADFIFPFETDVQERQYHDRLYNLLKSHYEYRGDAIVPLYQLECVAGVEFPLANAVLYPGGKQSCLATIVNNEDNHFRDADRDRIEHRSYLKFPVTGDHASRLEQVERETEQALQVLRFIYPWFTNDDRSYNPAHGVSMWKHSDRVIVYNRHSSMNNGVSRRAEIPNGIHIGRELSVEILRYAKKVRGLDDINYHFQTSATNPVSERICRSLGFYDTAAQSSVAQVAFSDFVISIDILLPSDSTNHAVLTDYLGSLIEHGKFYTGPMDLDYALADPKTTTWPERVRLTIEDFRQFYTTRGQILHGNKEDKYRTTISKSQVVKARQIAHNAIRAYACLARAFGWKTDKEAKAWFKSPHSPAREAES